MLRICMIFFSMSLMSLGLFAQENSVEIRTDFGSGVIQSTPSELILLNFQGRTEFPFAPKNFRIGLEVPLNNMSSVLISSGYGLTKSTSKSTNDINSFAVNVEATNEMTGFPVEAGFLFSLPIDQKERFFIRFGVLGGFYHYTLSQDLKVEPTNQPQNDIPDIKLSGIAQSFLFGISASVTSKFQVFMEMNKLGLSQIKVKQDIVDFLINNNGEIVGSEVVGEFEQDFNALNGLNDLGLVFGVSYSFGK